MNRTFIVVEVQNRFDVKSHATEREELKNAAELAALVQRKTDRKG
jgi:hypothetical protein